VLDFKAHEQQCTSVACSKANESVLVTVSTDGNINVWDIKNLDESDKPKLIQTKNLKVGGLFT
jgi:WD40 repeat protein